jgi:hypothetical protein
MLRSLTNHARVARFHTMFFSGAPGTNPEGEPPMSASFLSRSFYALLATLLMSGGHALALDIHMSVEQPIAQIFAVDDFQTTGADMAGMHVTATFAGGTSETVVWQATGLDSGGAFGPNQDWSLTQTGDTFFSPWTLFYDGNESKGVLTGFSIDGMAAGVGETGVMFDRTFGFVFGTPDSFHGWDYETLDPVPFDTLITYQSAVALPGEDPVGDLFRYLNVRFVERPDDEFNTFRISGLDGLDLRSVRFRQDTDNNIIPEPTTAMLLLTGAMMILARGRRRLGELGGPDVS